LFELVSPSGLELRAGGSLLRNFTYANQDERNYVEQIFGFARNKNTRVHLLKENSNPLGFVALSVRNFNEVPSVIIEYLFVSVPYRGRSYPHLSDPPLRVSEFLLGQAISMANSAWSMLPLRYMALNLASDCLEQLYSQYGFYRVEGAGSWMVLVLPAT
jgi:hypothetical protein